jgi:Fe-S cluster assembly ATP-binding protein
MEFLKAALDGYKARGEEPLSAVEFIKTARAVAASLELNPDFLKRGVNEGFSGGEKTQRNPATADASAETAILDETDWAWISMRCRRSRRGQPFRAPDHGILLVTHYQRLLDYIKPTVFTCSPTGASSKWRFSSGGGTDERGYG